MRDGHTFHLRFPFPFIMCRGRESVRRKGTRGFLVVGAPAEGPSPGASVEPDSFLLGRESLKLRGLVLGGDGASRGAESAQHLQARWVGPSPLRGGENMACGVRVASGTTGTPAGSWQPVCGRPRGLPGNPGKRKRRSLQNKVFLFTCIY